MFHAELRRFPHVTHAFNLSEADLHSRILDGWRAGRPIELGERRWVPDQTRLRILEGPELAANELALGRGWAAAQRRATDVTQRLLEGAAMASTQDRELAGTLLQAIARAPRTLYELWHLVHEHWPQRAAGDCLSAAERAVGVLLGENLAGVERGDPGGEVSSDEVRALLRDPASWASTHGPVLVAQHPGDDAGRPTSA